MMGADEHHGQMRAVSSQPAARFAVSSAAPLTDAYRHCEAITRARAANFYYGIRLLPAHKRRAMCAVYAFARRVDDIGDGHLPAERKLAELDGQLRALDGMDVTSDDSVMVALADASMRYPIPVAALGELLEGVRMDVEGLSYESFEDLLPYCRRVAGAIGRLCLAIFDPSSHSSARAAEMQRLADELGVALQLTNILRDLREDAEGGRVYLPREDLRRFGLLADGGEAKEALAAMREALGPGGADRHAQTGLSSPSRAASRDGGDERGLTALVRFEAARARQWFERGIALAPLLDRRSAACVLAMAGIYERVLDRIERDPERAIARRVALAAWEKAWVAAGSVLAPEARARRVGPPGRERIGAQR
jgi:phytoene synthase